LEDTWRPEPGKHLSKTNISDVFRSRATSRWTVAISTPVFGESPEKKFLGVVAMTVEVGQLLKFPGTGESQFAVLVDNRPGKHEGTILQHPLFEKLVAESKDKKLPERFFRVDANDLPNTLERQEHYEDPLANDDAGDYYAQRWLAQMESVRVRDQDTGLIVIVQEAYEGAIGTTLSELTRGLLRSGVIALGLIALVMAGLWGMAKKLSMSQ
jgi:hypothetical protein